MLTLFTIGHSNHPLEEFIKMLKAHHINYLIDIRAYPKSRRVYWFNKENLEKVLAKENIHYLHMPELGGKREPRANSINTKFGRPGFKGFADYMQTKEFDSALEKLNKLIKNKKHAAIMCVESLPSKCHRSFISDAEVTRGIQVLHIIDDKTATEHTVNEDAVIEKTPKRIKIYYPDKQSSLK